MREVKLPKNSPAQIQAAKFTNRLDGSTNDVLMLGHNIGPDGTALDKGQPMMVMFQAELNWVVQEPDGSHTHLCEINTDYHLPSGQKCRQRCVKWDRDDPRRQLSVSEHISGSGSWGIYTYSDINTVGKKLIGTDARNNNFIVNGSIFREIYDDRGNVAAHVPIVEVDERNRLVILGSRGDTVEFKGPVKFRDGVTGSAHVGSEIWTIEGGRIITRRHRSG